MHRVPQRDALAFGGPFDNPHQVRGLESPRWHREDARAGHIVRELIDEPQIRDHVPHEPVREDREIFDHERNLAGLERVDQLVAMRMATIQHGERAPFGSRAMQPLEFSGNPLRLGFARLVRDDPHFISIFVHGRQRVLGNVAWLFVVADHLSRHAQDSAGGTVIQGERPQQILPRSSGARGEALQKNREAAERRASKTVNRLAMIAHDDEVRPLAAQLPQQFQLRDVCVLELVDEDVPVARAKRFAQGFVRAQMQNGVHDLRAKGDQLALAQEKIACAVGSRNFLDPGDLFIADAALVVGHRAVDALKVFRLLRGIALVFTRRDQFVLTAREKIHEVAQKLSGLREAAVVLQLKQWQIAPQQDPVVDLVDGLEVGIDFLKQRVAERMKRAERDRLGAFHVRFAAATRRRDHAVLHLRRGLVCKCQAQNFLAREFRLGIEQITDALGDDASLTRAGAGHHHERTLAVLCRGALPRIELNARRWRAGVFKQVGHLERSQGTTVAQALRCEVNEQAR